VKTVQAMVKTMTDTLKAESFKERASSIHELSEDWVRVIRTFTKHRSPDNADAVFILEDRDGELNKVGKLTSFNIITYSQWKCMGEALVKECPTCEKDEAVKH
jgi:hypothetical protein